MDLSGFSLLTKRIIGGRRQIILQGFLIFIAVTMISAYLMPMLGNMEIDVSDQEKHSEPVLLSTGGGEWSGDQRLTDNIFRSETPAIALDSNGFRHVVWSDNRNGNPEIYYMRLNEKSVPMMDEMRVTTSLAPSIYPQVGVDGFGRIHISWLEISAFSWDLYYAILKQDGSFMLEASAIENVVDVVSWDLFRAPIERQSMRDKSPTAGLQPVMHVDQYGNVDIFLPISRNGTFDLFYCGVSGEAISRSSISSQRGDVAFVSAVKTDGLYHLVWEERGKDVALKYTTFSTEGHEAGDVFIIDQTVASSMFHSAISRIGDGRMLVSWAETSVTGWAQMAKIKGLVIEDSKPSQVIDLTTQYSYPRRLVSTETGEGVCLVWADERVGPSKTELVYAFYNASLTPASGRHLTSHIGESRSPAIASFQGNPVVVWEDSRNGNFEIYMTHRVPVSDAAVPAEEGAAPRPMILTPYEPAFIPGAGFGILAFLAYVAKHKELLLLIPAYSRLSNREIVENPTRKAILEHISQEPGVNFSSLMTDLDLKNGVLSHHLRTLERAGHIRSKKDGSLRRYYPSDCVLPMSLDEKLLYTLARNPGISETGLAEKLGVTRQVINYHIGKLLENRKVAVRREGRRTRCYALSLTPN